MRKRKSFFETPPPTEERVNNVKMPKVLTFKKFSNAKSSAFPGTKRMCAAYKATNKRQSCMCKHTSCRVVYVLPVAEWVIVAVKVNFICCCVVVFANACVCLAEQQTIKQHNIRNCAFFLPLYPSLRRKKISTQLNSVAECEWQTEKDVSFKSTAIICICIWRSLVACLHWHNLLLYSCHCSNNKFVATLKIKSTPLPAAFEILSDISVARVEQHSTPTARCFALSLSFSFSVRLSLHNITVVFWLTQVCWFCTFVENLSWPWNECCCSSYTFYLSNKGGWNEVSTFLSSFSAGYPKFVICLFCAEGNSSGEDKMRCMKVSDR